MNRDEYNKLFHKVELNLVAFKRLMDCDEEVLKLVNEAIAAEREACAKVAESKWVDFEELKTAHYRQTPEPFDPFRYHKDLGTIFMSRDLAAAIRARGNHENC